MFVHPNLPIYPALLGLTLLSFNTASLLRWNSYIIPITQLKWDNLVGFSVFRFCNYQCMMYQILEHFLPPKEASPPPLAVTPLPPPPLPPEYVLIYFLSL